MAVTIMQGDSYPVYVPLKLIETREVITPQMVSDVEITVGSTLRKTYAEGTVSYDSSEKEWYFTPTQEETLNLKPKGYEIQARVKFSNGEYSATKGIRIGMLIITKSNSKVVL